MHLDKAQEDQYEKDGSSAGHGTISSEQEQDVIEEKQDVDKQGSSSGSSKAVHQHASVIVQDASAVATDAIASASSRAEQGSGAAATAHKTHDSPSLGGGEDSPAMHTLTTASEDTEGQDVRQGDKGDVVNADGDRTAGFNSQTNYVNRKTIIIIFLCLATVTFIIVLDQTTLSVAAPIIGTDLNAGDRISFITASYFLTSTAFQFIYGRVSDFFGRKPLMMTLLVIFFIGSLGSSLSPDVISLVVFRAITGIAGGGLLTVGQFVIGDVVSLRDRGKYQGILGSIIVLGNGLGPLVGGALAQKAGKAGWRYIFRIMLPLCAFAFVIAWRFLPLKRVEGDWKSKARAVDWYGAALSFIAVALMVLGLSWAGGSYSWSNPHVLAPLLVGVGFAALFTLWQWKGTTPSRPALMPLGMFRHRIVIGAGITQMANGWLMYVQMYYIPQFYQLAYGYSPIVAGALLLPLLCVQSFSSTMSGLIVSKTGRYRELLLSGWALWSVGLGLFTTLDENSNKGKQIGFALLTGFGVGQTLQIALVALQGAVPRKEMAVVTSFRNFARSLGGALGLAISASIVNTVTINDLSPLGWTPSQVRQAIAHPSDLFGGSSATGASQLTPLQAQQLRAAYARGFRINFIVLAAIAAMSFLVTLLLMRHKNIDRADDALLKQQARAEARDKKKKRMEQAESINGAKVG